MRVRSVNSIEDLEALRDVWNWLEERQGGSTVFQSWAWNHAWCAWVLSRRKDMRIAVRLIESSSGQPLALLPLFEWTRGYGVLRVAQFMGHRMGAFNDVLLAEPKDADLACAVANLLRQDSRGVVHLRQMTDESAFTRELIRQRVAEPQCMRAWIEPGHHAFDPFSRLSRSRRKQLKRAERRLFDENSDVEVRVCAGDRFGEAFDDLVRLHAKRFAQLKKESLLRGDNVRFLQAVTTTLSSAGKAEIVKLACNGRAIAAVLQIVDRDRYYSIQSGFDPAYERYCPLWLLDIRSMRRAFGELACARYELGPIYNDYKYSWKPKVAFNYFASFGGRGILGRIGARGYRAAFRYAARRLTSRQAAFQSAVAQSNS